MTIDTVMDETQPVVLENKMNDFPENSKTSATSPYFGV